MPTVDAIMVLLITSLLISYELWRIFLKLSNQKKEEFQQIREKIRRLQDADLNICLKRDKILIRRAQIGMLISAIGLILCILVTIIF